jgi:hypothetical protein
MNEERQNGTTMSASVPVIAAVATVVLGCWAVVTILDWQLGFASTIFVTRDVAAIYCLCMVPLASLLATLLATLLASTARRRWSTEVLMAVATVSLSLCLPWIPATPHETDSVFEGSFRSDLLRAFVALGLMLSAASWINLFIVVSQRRTQSRRREPVSGIGAAILVSFLLASVVPVIYLQARCHHGTRMLTELLEQSRFGEARILVRELQQLAPSMQWRDRSLTSVSREINRYVRDLEFQVSASRAGSSGIVDDRLMRCRHLAMLGRTHEALVELMPLLDSPASHIACDLCGTIHETNAQWQTARQYHRRAKAEWHHQPSSPEREAGILRAATRLAYCERKLGHYDLAEIEYQEVLARSPTADTHFLLAQFYEDMQHSEKARAHARRAMELAPRQYLRDGTILIDKLAVGHFGCLGVSSAEWKRGGAVAAGSIPSRPE